MKFISHRGNLTGPLPDLENSPEFIVDAILKGFDVEVDLRKKGEKLFLGHDFCQYEIKESFLSQHKDQLWIHCKDLPSLKWLLSNDSTYNFFWHQGDDFSITTSGHIWTYPDKELSDISICVMPESSTYTNNSMYRSAGICSDYIMGYKRRYEDI